jgi:hypothetical protein
MRALRLGVVLVALAAAGVASTGFVMRGTVANACITVEGKVNSYTPAASHTCLSPIVVNQVLRQTETLKSTGSITFQTSILKPCIQWAGVDILRPTAAILLKHVSGTTWCSKAKGGKAVTRTLTAANAVIKVVDPTFGIVSDQRGTTVKVLDGSATVVDNAGRSVIVGANQQSFVPASGTAAPTVDTLVLSTDDRKVVTFLQDNALPTGAVQTLEYLNANKEKSAVVVAPDRQTAARLARALQGKKVSTLLASEVAADPNTLVARVNELSAKTVVVGGAFDTMHATLDTARRALPSTAILYVEKP